MTAELLGTTFQIGMIRDGISKAGDNLPQQYGSSWYYTRKEIEDFSPSRKDGIDLRKESGLRISYSSFLKDFGMRLGVEPRGFGFVKFHNPEDAAEAKSRMNHQLIGGREISIVFAEENRKTPQEMRSTSRVSDRYYGGGHRRRSPPRSPRRRYHSYSRSPSPPPRRDSRDRERDVRHEYYSPRHSVSASPRDDRDYIAHPSRSSKRNGRSPSRFRSYSPE